MEEFKLYSVSDDYVEWLRKEFPNVYSNKINSRTHTRKYLGVVLRIGEYHYYVPMSSPKDSDYQIAGTNKVIKKSIVPIIRIIVKNKNGEKELKGNQRNMKDKRHTLEFLYLYRFISYKRYIIALYSKSTVSTYV